MASFNVNQVIKKVAEAPKTRRSAEAAQRREFNIQKSIMLQDFDNHPVTQELKNYNNNPDAGSNFTNRGNLFSFFGFPAGSDPTNIIGKILNNNTSIQFNNKVITKTKIRFNFKISFPIEQIRAATPLPFSTRSWVSAIEKGLSNFSHYVFSSKFEKSNKSRSKRGIQSKTVRLGGSMKPISYLTEIFNNFKNSFR
ncbi:MAG: hypothetical protein HC836_12755 [Richelia sp. RM2_1_2]|nr:hypothetical protein [Richelia sp. RM2_1_2]